jgi:hypothetical protein
VADPATAHADIAIGAAIAADIAVDRIAIDATIASGAAIAVAAANRRRSG